MPLEGTYATTVGNQALDYRYYANGQLQSVTDETDHTLTVYEYDLAGNRTTEREVLTSGSGPSLAFAGTISDTRIAYDAQNRQTEVRGSNELVTYHYDSLGNRREINVVNYKYGGYVSDPPIDDWFTYDADNRIGIANGLLQGGAIVITTAQGNQNTYDASGNRRTMTTYEKSGGSPQQVVYQYDYDPASLLLDTKRQAGSGTQVLYSVRSYDTLGRLLSEYQYDKTGAISASANGHSVSYNGLGQALQQIDYTGNSSGTWTTSATVSYVNGPAGSTTGYDGAGNLLGYSVQGSTSGVGYTQNFVYYYVPIGSSYQTGIIDGSGHASSGSFTPEMTHEAYDANGHLAFVDQDKNDLTAADKVENFLENLQGQVVLDLQQDKDDFAPGGYDVQVSETYLYANGDPIGNISSDSSIGVDGASFGYNYTPVSSQYPSANPGQYVVQTGDTLQTVAEGVYGDASLWYLIADANGLTSAPTLTPGQILIVPNQVTNVHNNAATSRPYDANQAIGNQTPKLQYVPPAPDNCKQVAATIIGIIAIIVTVVTFQYELAPEEFAAAGTGAAAGGTGATTGTVAGTTTRGPAAAAPSLSAYISAGAIAGVAGNVTQQVLGNIFGVQHGVDFASLAASAIGGALSGGAQGLAGSIGVVGSAILADAGTQGVNLALGQQQHFSWSELAGAAVSAEVFGKTGQAPIDSYAANFSGETPGGTMLSEFGASALRQGTQIALSGHGKITWLTDAADAFGMGVGNLAVVELTRTGGERQAAQPVNPTNGLGPTAQGVYNQAIQAGYSYSFAQGAAVMAELDAETSGEGSVAVTDGYGNSLNAQSVNGVYRGAGAQLQDAAFTASVGMLQAGPYHQSAGPYYPEQDTTIDDHGGAGLKTIMKPSSTLRGWFGGCNCGWLTSDR